MPASRSLPPLKAGYELSQEDRKRFDFEFALGLVPLGSPILDEPAKAIPLEKIKSKQTAQLVDRLYEIALSQRGSSFASKQKGRGMVGLAAPQIGEPWRVMLVDTQVQAQRKSLGKLECFINPTVVWRSRETIEGKEGCFSTGPVWGIVRRPMAIKLAGIDPKGKPIERILEGFSARIALHELDHLDGIRFPERIKIPRNLHWVHVEELPLYDQHFKHWPRVCSEKRWRYVQRGELVI